MKLARRKLLQFAAGAAALPTVSRIARAQTYPSRPITMIVPTAAGASLDVVARIFAERMRQSLKQPIIIDNVGGADGSIAAGRAARARPDGYTVDAGYLGNHVLTGALYPLTYDLLNDFAPIVPLTISPSMLVARKSLPARDLNELIA
jgi:tripartite-type tricarboxylate transporter receptor subunit TctC